MTVINRATHINRELCSLNMTIVTGRAILENTPESLYVAFNLVLFILSAPAIVWRSELDATLAPAVPNPTRTTNSIKIFVELPGATLRHEKATARARNETGAVILLMFCVNASVQTKAPKLSATMYMVDFDEERKRGNMTSATIRDVSSEIPVRVGRRKSM